MLVRRLGGGAMGDVFEAQHVDLGSRVAIKLMRVSTHGDDTAARRALREGRSANAILHPNVVKILDTGSHEGVPYLVMEFLDGEDLGSVLKREGHLRAARISELLLPVVAGVAAAHRAGIVHRDLKPSNIVLARRHRKVEPVVVDFGISRSLHAAVETKASAQGAGSVLYMAPEQLRARAVTAKADQYALGVILYECATGGAPFYEEDHYALLNAIMTAPVVPPSELAPGLSPAFDALVLRALARDPEQRFESVEELGAALLAFADASTRAAWANELAPQAVTGTLVSSGMSLVSSGGSLIPNESSVRVLKTRSPLRWLPALALGGLALVSVAVSYRASIGGATRAATLASSGGSLVSAGGSLVSSGGSLVSSGRSLTPPDSETPDLRVTLAEPAEGAQANALARPSVPDAPQARAPDSPFSSASMGAPPPAHTSESAPKIPRAATPPRRSVAAPSAPAAVAMPPAAPPRAPDAPVERGTANIPIIE